MRRLICLIFGHRWDVFTAEQCPEIYRVCERCDRAEHVCNAQGEKQWVGR